MSDLAVYTRFAIAADVLGNLTLLMGRRALSTGPARWGDENRSGSQSRTRLPLVRAGDEGSLVLTVTMATASRSVRSSPEIGLWASAN